MIIFPAIDIKNGKCVRLQQGQFDKVNIYAQNPVEVALRWEQKGAKYIHVVDLDGALRGRSINKEVIRDIVRSVNIPVQLGGGIRNLEDISDALNDGVSRAIIGTSAVKKEGFVKKALESYGDKVVVSIDAKGGHVAIEGWTQTSQIKALDFGKELESAGLKTLVYTDIAKDGMLSGPNFKELENMKNHVNVDVIASGGISSKEHIKKLKELNLYGAIIGKALYTGAIKLEDL
jgi:phosphoribosylformimino-5-aminoimidazole carboxamide ribotide isomerase